MIQQRSSVLFICGESTIFERIKLPREIEKKKKKNEDVGYALKPVVSKNDEVSANIKRRAKNESNVFYKYIFKK